jgi:hypothetical protein
MSQYAVIKQLVEETVRGYLGGHKKDDGDAPDANDVTQLKRENTGLRNRVKALEERVDAIEKSLKPDVTVKAGTASATTKAHGTK